MAKKTDGALKAAIARWEKTQAVADALKRQIERMVWSAAAAGAPPARGPGRPRGKRVGPTVREMIAEALAGGKALTPAEITGRIVRKHPGRNSRNFYNQVFTNLSRAKECVRKGDGTFVLKAGKTRKGKRGKRK
ncbi:MAG: hypothetical protein JXP34_25565 [Planctomycetes bacterium]|nr:hypothetical protein [Planctomycetota bacterium]